MTVKLKAQDGSRITISIKIEGLREYIFHAIMDNPEDVLILVEGAEEGVHPSIAAPIAVWREAMPFIQNFKVKSVLN